MTRRETVRSRWAEYARTINEQYPDSVCIFFIPGEPFAEAFGNDAIVIAEVTGLPLSLPCEETGGEYAIGIPVGQFPDCCNALVAKGHKIALAEPISSEQEISKP